MCCISISRSVDESRDLCDRRGKGSLETIPLSFDSTEEYVSVFEPLLHEEARAGVQVRGMA